VWRVTAARRNRRSWLCTDGAIRLVKRANGSRRVWGTARLGSWILTATTAQCGW
jgi:hypothetical protein